MSKSTARTHRKDNLTTAAMSFVGVLAAAPLAMSLYGAPTNVSATDDQPGVSQALSVDDAYAQYAHAYTQGYLANQTRSATAGTVMPGACSEQGVAGAEARNSDATGQVQGVKATNGYGGGGGGNGGYVAGDRDMTEHHRGKVMAKKDWVKNVYHSYKSYNSASNTVHNTNSNNVVGSHNSTKTEVEVKDSKGVYVGTHNNATNTNIGLSHSLNNDSYNTKTTNTAINNSFNEEKNVHSGNTTNTMIDADVELTLDSHNNSYNTKETNTKIETEVTTNVDKSVNIIGNTVSDDDVIIKDNEVDIEFK